MNSHSARLPPIGLNCIINRRKYIYEQTLLYLQKGEQTYKPEAGIGVVLPSLALCEPLTRDLYNIDNLCILDTFSHMTPVNWDNQADMRALFWAQILFLRLIFHYLGGKNIFVSKHSNCNRSDLGSIFVIEERTKQRKNKRK